MSNLLAKIRPDGYGSYYYASFGSRSKRSFRTIKGAIRAAEARGIAVDMDDLPNPNAKSVARFILVFDNGETLTFNEGGAHIKGSLESMNHVLKKMGYKPVRITRNTITGNGTPFVIDADTPLCCDPGSETYHSM